MIKNPINFLRRNKVNLNPSHHSLWPAMPAPHCLPTLPCTRPKYLFIHLFLVLPQQPGAPLPDGISWGCWGWQVHLRPVLPCWFLRLCPSLQPCLLLQLPHSQLLEQVEVVSSRAGEQRRKKSIYTWVFWKLESRGKLKNVTWGQNVWLSSYREERGRFIPIATLWPVSCRNFPAPWMCGGFRGASPSLVCFLQLCGRKVITEESAALQETRLRWNRGLGVIPGTSRGYNSSCHCPPQLSFHTLFPESCPSNC